MSKFNKANTYETTNLSGNPAFAMDAKEELMTRVLTSMCKEPKFYGDTTNEIADLATSLCKTEPAFVAKLAVFARKEMNLRSISHLLASIIAHEAKEYTRFVIRNIVLRTDDVTEILACYEKMYGKPFPNAMKREIANVVKKFDEYQFAKHKDGAIKMKDVFRIVHPKPENEEMSELFSKVVNDSLKTPETWEVLISQDGNNYYTWRYLLEKKKLPYMALLRNLRNIIKAAEGDPEKLAPFLEYLTNEEAVLKSKQLPFRYFSTYAAIKDEFAFNDYNLKDVYIALDKALRCSSQNLPFFEGRTLIAVDVSSSMYSPISSKSSVKYVEIATLLGGLSASICEDATICFFSSHSRSSSGYQIKRIGKYDNLLEWVYNQQFYGGCTEMYLPLHYAIQEDLSRMFNPFDRIIFLSDNECNSNIGGLPYALLQRYRDSYNKNMICHAVDLQGYGTTQFKGSNTYIYAGWSDRILEYIHLIEKGMDNMVKIVEEYITI